MENSFLPGWGEREEHLEGRGEGEQEKSQKMNLLGSTPHTKQNCASYPRSKLGDPGWTTTLESYMCLE